MVKTLHNFLWLFIVSFLWGACQQKQVQVGLLVSDANRQTAELAALCEHIASEKNVRCEYIEADNLSRLGDYDIVWYHRIDSTDMSATEAALKSAMLDYVSSGGKLILSMDAVCLLNTWGIESEPICEKKYNAVDEGFGRKVGFHAYREHPLFDKMFGGAYTWHGKEDNVCRVKGFFGDNRPKAENSKVIGTLWEYIFYHPEDKILWETQVGDGKILAIGGFLYYSKDNFHGQILNQFTQNCLDYLAGKKMESKVMYWENRGAEVVQGELAIEKVDIKAPVAWNLLPDSVNTLSWEAGESTVDLPSQRSILVAQERGGIEEIWTHPMLSLRDYRVWLDVEGQDTLVSLRSCRPFIELRPNAITRVYRNDDLSLELKETLVSQVDTPVTVAHYEWTGGNIRRIVVDCKSNLRFMWPYDELALGSINYYWSADANAWVVYDTNKEFVSLVGSNVPGQMLLSGRYDAISYPGKQPVGEATDKLQVAAAMAYDVQGMQALDMFLVAGNEGVDKALATYREVVVAPRSVFETSQAYYNKYLAECVSIVTPDPVFNDGIKWATLSSSQFIVETPGIGKSLMAGYSSSRRGWGGAHKVSGRPGYAWYFGRDAVWAAFAFADMGDLQTVRDVLETLIHFQQVDGKIYHELTSSGSVHFDASDATPLFVNLMARYAKASGDLAFVKKHIGSVIKAMDYCYSTDTDGDHLIEITNVGHGWLEGGALYGSHTEFYLVGLWNAALNDAAYLAALVGDTQREQQYRQEASVVNKIINRDFWNEKGFFNYGKYKDGSYTKECIVLTSVPVYMQVTDPQKAYRMVSDFASSRYSADWGVRMIDETNPIFNPRAYHYGSVWPLFTGWTSLAEYEVGRYNQGFSHIMSNLLNYKGLSYGRMPEVLNGSVYQSSGVTLHQCWSETMVLQPVVEGMLGFVPDAFSASLTLAPRIPFDWNTLQVANLKVGESSVSFDMTREKGKVTYRFVADKALKMNFIPSFALGTEVDKVLVDGKEIPFRVLDNREYVDVALEAQLGASTTIEVLYHGGAAVLPQISPLVYGKTSNGVRIICQQQKDGMLETVIEGRAGSSSTISLYLPDGYRTIEGTTDEVPGTRPDVRTFGVSFDKSQEPYVTKTIKVSF